MIDREKLLLPYILNDEYYDCFKYIRKSIIPKYWFCIYGEIRYGIIIYSFKHFNSKRMEFKNLKEAKNELDSILINNGFVLIPKDKVEQYKLLL
jgi:hypothetical protein